MTSLIFDKFPNTWYLYEPLVGYTTGHPRTITEVKTAFEVSHNLIFS